VTGPANRPVGSSGDEPERRLRSGVVGEH
jgi:hypothetical protein